MLHFFTKKRYLLDFMLGVPDIHCHVLPGIDDGSTSISQSTLLLEKYKSLGFSTIIATPHSMGGMYENTAETIKLAWSSVKEKVPNINLSYASEYMLDDYFEKLLDNDEILTLSNNYILVELSYFQPPINLKELLFKITSKGYVPILAHPERYAYYHNDINQYSLLKQYGCLLQLNALSLSAHYGKRMQRTAFELLEKDMYTFVATDAHRLEHLEKIEKITISTKKIIPSIADICRETKRVFS